jgi:hypothetical protein
MTLVKELKSEIKEEFSVEKTKIWSFKVLNA